MAKHVFIVLTNALPGRDDEFNDWYDHRHLNDVTRVPGIIGARRYKLSSVQRPGASSSFKYLAIYDVECDDLQSVVSEFRARAGTDAMVMSSAMDIKVEAYFFDPI